MFYIHSCTCSWHQRKFHTRTIRMQAAAAFQNRLTQVWSSGIWLTTLHHRWLCWLRCSAASLGCIKNKPSFAVALLDCLTSSESLDLKCDQRKWSCRFRIATRLLARIQRQQKAKRLTAYVIFLPAPPLYMPIYPSEELPISNPCVEIVHGWHDKAIHMSIRSASHVDKTALYISFKATTA